MAVTVVFLGTVAVSVSADGLSWRQSFTRAGDLCGTGQWQLALQAAKIATDAAEVNFGDEHLNTAKSLSLLADICTARGIPAQGVLFLERTLYIRAKLHGPYHPVVVKLLTDLADLHRVHGNAEDTEWFYQKALLNAEKGGWAKSRYSAPAMEGLADLYMDQGGLDRAELLYHKALAIYEFRRKYSPSDDSRIAKILSCLAEINKLRRNFPAAAGLYKRTLAKYTLAEGPDSLKVASVHKRVAELYTAWGRTAQAVPYFKRALATYHRAGQPDSLMVGATMVGLARIYKSQNRSKEAETLYSKAEAIYGRNRGVDKALVSRLVKHTRIWPLGGHESR